MNRFAALIIVGTLTLGISPLSLADASTSTDTLHNEASFYELGPISFSLRHAGGVLGLRSSHIRLSYSFHPAVRAPSTKPLFVFFERGPGLFDL
jgi:hypothetical protein